MQSFRRRRGELSCTFEPEEASVLLSLLDQLCELLGDEALGAETSPAGGAVGPGGASATADASAADASSVGVSSAGATSADAERELFARLEAELGVEPAVADFAHDSDVDPVLRRLFPDAYSDDPAASFEFRRFTQTAQRDAKLAAAAAVRADVTGLSGHGRCVVPSEHVGCWLTTLTALRLALAVRLEISDEDSAEHIANLPSTDPRTMVFSIYEWLGWVQESLLDCLN